MIQPFSQVISASPLVRLRVGDVIQSNYNDASLRSLFGVGTEKYSGPSKLQIYQQFFKENDIVPPATENLKDYETVLNYMSAEYPDENYKKKFEKFSQQDFTKNGFFFDEANNSIVKSFKENGAGGGLAGFVGSLQFNWLQDGHTWETNNLNDIVPGSDLGVAPKIVEVQMSFKPVHDISPGLNSGGFNRAPIYPLKFMRNKLDNPKK
jgi:hypothetical protein